MPTEAEQKYKTIFDLSPEAIVLLDTKGKVLGVNGRVYDWLGYKPEEITGKTLTSLSFLPKKSKVKVMKKFLQRMLGKEIPPYELDFTTKEGENRIGLIRATPIKDENGKITGDLVMISDITEHKLMDKTLQESEEKFRAIFETAQDSIFIKDRILKYVQVNPSMAKLFGLPVSELIGHTDDDIFGKEAGVHIKEVDSQVLNGKIIEEEHTKPVSGISKTFHVIKVPMRDTSGKIIGLCGIARDITERKQTEEMLREKEERFRALTESTSDWIWEVDANGIYTYASPKVKDLLGYKPEEVIGKAPFDFMPDEERKQIGTEFGAIAKAKRPFERLENWNLHKDGRLVLLETSGIPILGENGELQGYRGIDRDITERKKAEEELKKKNEDLERFNKMAVGREMKMIELKKEINTLLKELGKEPQYKTSEQINTEKTR